VEDATALLAAAEGDDDQPWYALLVVMLYCGLRPGEVTGLPWGAVNLDKGTLTVRQSRKREGGKDKIGPVKTKSDRVLALHPVLVEALKDHRRRQEQIKTEESKWVEMGLVFPNTLGLPIDPINLRRAITRLSEVAGIQRAVPYEMRHTAATLLVDAGNQLPDVADFLGHVDTTMLVETYRHRSKRVVDLTASQEEMYR
jgi:integrase